MKQWGRIVLALAAVMVGALGAPRTAQAVLLSNTSISSADFATFAGAAVVPALLTTYDLAPPGPDGDVASRVFTGIGPAAGLFVYVYDTRQFVGSSEPTVGGLALDFFTDPSLTPFDPDGAGPLPAITSFIISTPPLPPPPGAPFLSTAPADGGTSSATWISGVLKFNFDVATGLNPGEYSGVFGTFSPLEPTTVIADVLGTGVTHASPTVYSPVIPEPTSMLLIGFGLLGGLVGGRKRFGF